MSQGGVNGLRVAFGFELRLVNPNQFFPPARVFAEAIVSDAVEPGGKLRLAAEAADVPIRADERFLREIIREREIAPRELTKEPAHRRLMPSHEFREGVLIFIEEDSCDE